MRYILTYFQCSVENPFTWWLIKVNLTRCVAEPSVSQPDANAPAKLRLLHQSSPIFYQTQRIIGDVYARMPVVILLSVNCGMPAHRMKVGLLGYANFCLFAPNISTSLERSRNESWTDHMCTYRENLAKIGLVHSEITAWSPRASTSTTTTAIVKKRRWWKKVTSAKHEPGGMRCWTS